MLSKTLHRVLPSIKTSSTLRPVQKVCSCS